MSRGAMHFSPPKQLYPIDFAEFPSAYGILTRIAHKTSIFRPLVSMDWSQVRSTDVQYPCAFQPSPSAPKNRGVFFHESQIQQNSPR